MPVNKWLFRIGITALIFCAGLSAAFLLQSYSKHKHSLESEYRSAFKKNYRILSPYVPEKIEFAGEKVPLEMFYVKEGLDRELLVNTYWQSNSLLMLKRAWRFFPVIEPILKENGIPDDFKYLALIESGFDNVVSPAGAAGFWQFLKSTATSYGLEVNDEVDERYNLEKSTVAACKYLKSAKNTFGSWTMAAAAYNMGSAGLTSQAQTQKTNNYFDLSLNTETSRYVYRILAIKIIFERPTDYGFYLRKYDLYQPVPTQIYKVDSSITNLADFAIQMKVSYKALKVFNPWLRKNSLKNTNKKVYQIILPQYGFSSVQTLSEPYNDDEIIYGDTISINQIR